jgi:hypothetical protein
MKQIQTSFLYKIHKDQISKVFRWIEEKNVWHYPGSKALKDRNELAISVAFQSNQAPNFLIHIFIRNHQRTE